LPESIIAAGCHAWALLQQPASIIPQELSAPVGIVFYNPDMQKM